MDKLRPSFAFVHSSVERTSSQHAAKAFRVLAEKDLGMRSIDFDVERQVYSDARVPSPYRRLEAVTKPIMILTTLWGNRRISDKAVEETEGIRAAVGTEIPVFAVNADLEEEFVDLGSNMFGAHVESQVLFDRVRDLQDAGGNEAITEIANDDQYDFEARRLRTITDYRRSQLNLQRQELSSGETSQRVHHCFGYAVDADSFANEWTMGYGTHYKSVENLNAILNIADAVRAKQAGTTVQPKDSKDRNIFFGFQWNGLEHFQTPLVELFLEPDAFDFHTEENVSRVGGHLLEEKKVIPVTQDFNVIDQSFVFPVN